MKSEPKVVMLHINDILPNRFQPRIHFNEDKIQELAESIKKYGVIQPITVRALGDKYEIIAGERRYKASVMAGLEMVPAIINNLNDKDSSEIALIENVQREDLTPIEEAVSYRKILDMGDLTQEDLAKKLGVTQATVANKLRLLQLTDDVQEALLENKISERHARSLLRVRDKEKQVQLLYRIMQERMTVRKADEEIKKILEEDLEKKGKGINPGFMDIDKIEKEAVDIQNISPNIIKPEPKESQTEPDFQVEEQEILDFINSLNIKKGEEETMNNNDPINQFDLPQVNIIDDIPTEQLPKQPEPAPVEIMPEMVIPSTVGPVEPERTIQQQNPQMINPGFMDIDKIQREAADIAPKSAPVASEFNFMPTPGAEPEVVPQEVELPKEPAGKFFDVLPSMENVDANHQIVSEVAPSNTSIFSDDSPIFSDLNIPTPAPVEAPTVQNTFTEQTPNILENPFIDPVPAPAPQQSSGIAEVAVPEIVQPEFVQPIVEEPQAPVEDIFSQPAMVVETPTIEPLRLEPVETIPTPVPVPTPEVTYTPMGPEAIPNAHKFEEPIIPLQPEGMNEAATAPVIKVPEQPMVEEPQVPVSTTLPLSFNIREGINMVRNLSNQLEGLGIKVDIEEMDLPGHYEVRIKMEK
ncbi:MAG: ParB/RepB/Spo0J family partition protein [Bacilli bacterium]|nr:ParB/RepB/Spo0J family partition protein [Bacilli bacterium]